MTKLESKFEDEFKSWVEYNGGLTLKLPAVYYAGIPDRVVLYNGKIVFIELKREGQYPRLLQEMWIKRLTDLGFLAFWMNYKTFITKYKPNGIDSLWLPRGASE